MLFNCFPARAAKSDFNSPWSITLCKAEKADVSTAVPMLVNNCVESVSNGIAPPWREEYLTIAP